MTGRPAVMMKVWREEDSLSGSLSLRDARSCSFHPCGYGFSRTTASRPKKYFAPVEAGFVPTTSARRTNLPSFGLWTPRLIRPEGAGLAA